jgi:hypothetical protein
LSVRAVSIKTLPPIGDYADYLPSNFSSESSQEMINTMGPNFLPNNPTDLNTELLNVIISDLSTELLDVVISDLNTELLNVIISDLSTELLSIILSDLNIELLNAENVFPRFEDTSLFKGLTEGHLVESIKLLEAENESKNGVMTSSYFSKRFKVDKICNMLYK